jgi:hypothetical protein
MLLLRLFPGRLPVFFPQNESSRRGQGLSFLLSATSFGGIDLIRTKSFRLRGHFEILAFVLLTVIIKIYVLLYNHERLNTSLNYLIF